MKIKLLHAVCSSLFSCRPSLFYPHNERLLSWRRFGISKGQLFGSTEGKSENSNLGLFSHPVSFAMTLPCHFFIFFFGLLVLRAAEVSSSGRKTFRGKFLFSIILGSLGSFQSFLRLWKWPWIEHHVCKQNSAALSPLKAVEIYAHFVTSKACRDLVFVTEQELGNTSIALSSRMFFSLAFRCGIRNAGII